MIIYSLSSFSLCFDFKNIYPCLLGISLIHLHSVASSVGFLQSTTSGSWIVVADFRTFKFSGICLGASEQPYNRLLKISHPQKFFLAHKICIDLVPTF